MLIKTNMPPVWTRKKCHLANLKNYLKDMPPGEPEELLKKNQLMTRKIIKKKNTKLPYCSY